MGACALAVSEIDCSVDAITLGRNLLGQRLVRVVDGVRRSGLIVETEAYVGIQDRASHAYGGRRTPRNESMYLSGGHVYVYFTYGMHHCVNVVCGGLDEPAAVLIRALEPEEGISEMARSRGKKFDPIHEGLEMPGRPKNVSKLLLELCNGPGKLSQALEIDRTLDGLLLTNLQKGRRRAGVFSPILFIEKVRQRALPGHLIAASTRVGLGQVGSWKKRNLRFSIIGNPNVSVTVNR